MNFETEQKLDKLSQIIKERVYDELVQEDDEWDEYDVRVVSRADESGKRWTRLPVKSIDYHHTEPRRRLVATRYSAEVVWLFKELRTIHPEEIERYNWHDFYAILADTANHYIEVHKGSTTATRLLEEVIRKVREIYR